MEEEGVRDQAVRVKAGGAYAGEHMVKREREREKGGREKGEGRREKGEGRRERMAMQVKRATSIVPAACSASAVRSRAGPVTSSSGQVKVCLSRSFSSLSLSSQPQRNSSRVNVFTGNESIRGSCEVDPLFFDGSVRARRTLVISAAKKKSGSGGVSSGRVCQLTGKKRLNSSYLTFSHKKIRNVQYPNLQNKRIFWEEGQRWVKMKISTKAMRTLDKKGLEAMAKEAGINLWDLPHQKYDPSREEWKKENPYPSKQFPKKLKSRRRNKWLLPNSLRGSQAWVPEEESRPIIGDVVDGKIIRRAAEEAVEVKSNLRVTRRVAENTEGDFFGNVVASMDAELPPMESEGDSKQEVEDDVGVEEEQSSEGEATEDA